MASSSSATILSASDAPGRFPARLKEISTFFQGTDAVHQAVKNVTAALEKAGISYAIVGGMAVNAHRHSRTTKDVDFLVSTNGWLTFKQLIVAGVFNTVPGRSRRFIDPATGVHFDILIAGGFPGNGLPGPIAYPDPATVSQRFDDLFVVDLPTLVELKLAARRYQDFADVVSLIRANQLDETFGQRLAPSVQKDFIECLEEMRREDLYESRQDSNANTEDSNP